MSCGEVDVEESSIKKKEFLKGFPTGTHSDQSVAHCERTFSGCWTALDDGGDVDAALQTDPAV